MNKVELPMNNIRAEVTFGTQFDRDNREIDSLVIDAVLRKIDALAVELFGGVTWIDTHGSWESPAGEIVTEQGQIIIINTFSSHTHEVFALAKFIRDELRQTCVALSITPADFSFV